MAWFDSFLVGLVLLGGFSSRVFPPFFSLVFFLLLVLICCNSFCLVFSRVSFLPVFEDEGRSGFQSLGRLGEPFEEFQNLPGPHPVCHQVHEHQGNQPVNFSEPSQPGARDPVVR